VKPGEIRTPDQPVPLNAGRRSVEVKVTNDSSWPVGVGSHYHFFEVNRRLRFEREPAYGMRLDAPAGSITWFASGETRAVRLVPLAGRQEAWGFQGLVNGPLDQPPRSEDAPPQGGSRPRLHRAAYAKIYGPTTGDRIRLADSDLWVEIEEDATSYGDEPLVGLGKTIRDGMLASPRVTSESELDLVITNVVVLDPVLGVRKTNIGIKDGRIAAVGRAGNPDVVDDIDVLIGTDTTLIAGEGLIATPGIVDSHVHLMSPRVVPAALSAGVTTLVGMGSGPAWDIGVNPRFTLERMFAAFAGFPINTAFLARGSSSLPGPLERCIEGGAAGFKVHEDTGATGTALHTALAVAEAHDVAVAVHFDGLGESGELDDFLAAVDGRAVHAYHVEGAGGGPINLLEAVSRDEIIPSSTTPTIPFTVNAVEEHLDMIVSAHALNPEMAGDQEAARIRIRPSTMAAEELLHDLGAISIINSDALGMGRVGESLRRTIQMASRMKRLLGEEDSPDNERVLRHLAKLTINPALTHGMAHVVGSLELGKLADLVLWRPGFFGVKPEMVVKGGFLAWGAMGEGNASVERAQPVTIGPLFGGEGATSGDISLRFVAKTVLESRLALEWHGRPEPIQGTRKVRKTAMVRNGSRPDVKVDPETLQVRIDGTPVQPDPATDVSLNRLYLLS
jgi:urease subunit alpha